MVLFLLHNYFHTFEKATTAAKTAKNTIEMSNEEIKKKVIRNVAKDTMIKSFAETFVTRIVGFPQSLNERKDENPTRKTYSEYFKSYRWQK